MSKQTDQTTDGKGAVTDVLGTSGDANAGQNSDTSTDTKSKADENKQDNSASAIAPADEPEGDDLDDELLPGDDGAKRFSQTDVDRIVTERLRKQRENLKKQSDAKISSLEAQVKQLTTELSGYRKAEAEQLKAEFDALDESVKALAPGDISKPEDLSVLKAWLPKAKALMAKIRESGASGEQKKPAPQVKAGNGDDPAPISDKMNPADEAEIIRKARQHSIYSSF